MIRKRKRGRVPDTAPMPLEWSVIPKFVKPPPAPDGYWWQFHENARWFYLYDRDDQITPLLWFTTTPHNKPVIGLMNYEDDYGWTYDRKDTPDVVAFVLSVKRLKKGGHV